MLDKPILTETVKNSNEQTFACAPHGDDPKVWLQTKIDYYTAELDHLQKELKHYQALLRGHKIWLEEAERRLGVNNES